METTLKDLIIITGPTAVGKTAASIGLAKAVGGEIISADSMQVYKHMDIGTAKITPEEMSGVKHYLIDELEPDEEFNIVKFQQRAKQAMGEIAAHGHIPVIAGGTGFYIQSVVYDVDFNGESSVCNDGVDSTGFRDFTEHDDSYRAGLRAMADGGRQNELHSMLAAIDPVSAENIHPNNVKRVIRALEYFHQTGVTISEHNREQSKKESPYRFAYFVLNDERAALYERINRRVDKMIACGLVEEVRRLKEMGYDRSFVSMQGIGYKEILDYLDGRITLDEAVYIIKRDTRHFAKRQITWFKREKEVIWVNIQDFDRNMEKVQAYMLDILKSKNII